MKTKYAVGLFIIGLGVAVSLFAAEQKADTAKPRILLLQAHGETIAELRLLKNDTFEFSGGDTNKEPGINFNASTGQFASKNGFTIKISREGNIFQMITIKADEIAMPHSDK